ncbi:MULTISPECIES: tyrosine-type recombinase/integrase [Actinomadura]|uniref:Tyrosine-type recombinase/integrase n=1 Tax=Actinomadura yumaensis TaxID=111807 RepID=A0ABW2CUZ1_9ACTN|nr:tyrosine-type recombinase/integrase [Actinomadura sp. J1-007]MWK39609.1 tyrosine-type recombinase/integrase [Actinomadura sp. J1-007]
MDAIDEMVETLEGLRRSWLRSLRAANASSQTLRAYGRAITMLIEFLSYPPEDAVAGEESPAALLERLPVWDEADIRRDHLEAFIGHLHRHYKPNTVNGRWSALHVFFNWLVEQPDIPVTVSPMTGMRRPFIPEEHPPILDVGEIRALLRTCSPRDYHGVRDEAIIRLMADTGLRINEVVTLMITDVIDGQRVPVIDMDLETVYVMGKGRRPRSVSFGAKTAAALDRYLRARRKHPHRTRPEFFLREPRYPTPGGLTEGGITRMLQRRAEAAGIKHVHPHMFRHTWAAAQKRSGLDRGAMKNQGGWRSDKMPDRYGAIVETDRSLEAHRRTSFGDEI